MWVPDRGLSHVGLRSSPCWPARGGLLMPPMPPGVPGVWTQAAEGRGLDRQLLCATLSLHPCLSISHLPPWLGLLAPLPSLRIRPIWEKPPREENHRPEAPEFILSESASGDSNKAGPKPVSPDTCRAWEGGTEGLRWLQEGFPGALRCAWTVGAEAVSVPPATIPLPPKLRFLVPGRPGTALGHPVDIWGAAALLQSILSCWSEAASPGLGGGGSFLPFLGPYHSEQVLGTHSRDQRPRCLESVSLVFAGIGHYLPFLNVSGHSDALLTRTPFPLRLHPLPLTLQELGLDLPGSWPKRLLAPRLWIQILGQGRNGAGVGMGGDSAAASPQAPEVQGRPSLRRGW